jgi:SCF-associated factor 1
MEEMIESHNHTMNAQQNKVMPTRDNVIPCSTWSLQMDPIMLPSLPSLPTLMEIKDEIRLIKIAGFDNNLIGLTNQGHVLKFDSLRDEQSSSRGQWTYVCGNRCLPHYDLNVPPTQLPNFSEVDKVRQNPVFSPPEGEEKLVSELPETMQITHVSIFAIPL